MLSTYAIDWWIPKRLILVSWRLLQDLSKRLASSLMLTLIKRLMPRNLFSGDWCWYSLLIRNSWSLKHYAVSPIPKRLTASQYHLSIYCCSDTRTAYQWLIKRSTLGLEIKHVTIPRESCRESEWREHSFIITLTHWERRHIADGCTIFMRQCTCSILTSTIFSCTAIITESEWKFWI